MRIFASFGLCLLAGTAALAQSVPSQPADPAGHEYFEKMVRPILVRHCYACHSHAANKMRGGLALDSRSGWEKGGDLGPAVVPGRPDDSLLIQAVRHTHPDLKMPKQKLGDADIATLSEWVRRGAPDPRVLARSGDQVDWWSLRALVAPRVPDAKSAHPIDAFIDASLRTKGLQRSPEADRRTLIRRLTFDLHGLPPTPEEVDAFVAGTEPHAYEKLVDRLLASPRYGERWARHWLDVVRYGDSNGNEHDGFREHAWRYRDYVIDAFNRDRPYDRFIQEQLAADALFPEEVELTAALGFLAAGPDVLSGTDYLIRDEFVTTAMSAFASTTAHCARCHHHKFDPISQEDYYALQAIFAGVQRKVVPLDTDPVARATRAKWTALKTAAAKRDRNVLLSAENRNLVAAWEKTRNANGSAWKTLQPGPARATSASLEVSKEGTLSATKTADTDAYMLTIPGPLADVRLLRLEVLGSLADDGAISLSEIELTQFSSAQDKGNKVGIKTSLSDDVEAQFTQKAKGKNAVFEVAAKKMTSTLAHDGKEDTGWTVQAAGNLPRVVVFELNGNVKIPEVGRLEIVLKQRQAKKLLGRFRLSVGDQSLSPYTVTPFAVAQALAVPAAQRTENDWLALAAHALPIVSEEQMQDLPAQTSYYVVGSAGAPKTVNILKRGDMSKPAGVAIPGALSCVPDLKARMDPASAKEEAARRAYLARWLSDRQHPLTWRSIVNRVWHHHFGRGLVDTPNDFGQMGSRPSHPELLDWLACEFRDQGMSFKKLHRLIVTSATYRQAVASNPAAEKIDVDNRLLWRMNRNRLDAESFRDTVLAVAGRLDLKMGGPGVLQFEVKPGFNTTKLANYDAIDWDAPGVNRRSVYRFIFRTRPDPFMSALDFPDASQFVPTRPFSVSPLQALVLFNNHFVLHHCDHLARRIAPMAKEPTAQVRQAFRLTLQRDPTTEEAADFAAYADRHGLAAMCRVLLNSNEFLFVD